MVFSSSVYDMAQYIACDEKSVCSPRGVWRCGGAAGFTDLQGNLAHKKTPTPLGPP